MTTCVVDTLSTFRVAQTNTFTCVFHVYIPSSMESLPLPLYVCWLGPDLPALPLCVEWMSMHD
jgi:hypothetical protein